MSLGRKGRYARDTQKEGKVVREHYIGKETPQQSKDGQLSLIHYCALNMKHIAHKVTHEEN